VTALLNLLYSFRYYAPLVAVVALFWWHRFTFTTWFLKQFVTAAYGFAVSPVTEQQNQDINFWGAQIFGSVVVIMATWIVLTSSGWKAWILANVFESPIQKAVFKHFCMQALEDAVFLFTMRQVVVLTSWVVVPPAVQTDASSFAGSGAWLRHFVDARLATLLYIVTSLCWFGASVNLFTLPIDPMGRAVVSAALRGAVYLGVAVVRVYPLLNGRGVGLLEFVLVLVTRYPLLAMALGWAAVAPAEWAGRQLRSRAGVTFYSIAGINAVNVASMLWSSAAGRHIAELMLDAEGTAAAGAAAAAAAANATAAGALAEVGGAAAPALLGLSLSTPVELLFRALLLMLCGAALSMYVHALYLLYYSSPLLRCEFDWPRVTRVEFLEGGQVVDKVWALYSRHLEASVAASMASLKGSLSSTLASVLGAGRPAALQRGASTDSASGSGSGSGAGSGGAVPVELPPDGVAASLQRGDSTASEAGAGASTPGTGAAAAPAGPSGGGGGGEDTGDRLLSLLMDVLDVAMSLHALAEGERFAIRFAASVRARNTTGRPMLLQACAIDVLAAPAPSAEGGLVMAAQGAGGSAVPYLQELQHLGQSAADAVPVVPPTLPVLTLHLDPLEVPAAGQADEGEEGNEAEGAGADGDGAEGEEGGYYTCTVQVSVVAYLHVDNIVTLLQALPSWWSSGGSGAARAGRQAGGLTALHGRRAPSQASLLGLSTLFATLYMRSPLSPSFVFSVPLLTWLRGQWRGIGLLDPSRYSQHLDISAALQNRAKLSALAENLSAKRASGTAGEVRQLPAEMQTDVAKLLLILQRINARGNVAAAAAASGLAAALSGEDGGAGGGRGQGHPAAFAGHALAASRGSRSSDGATPSGGSTRAPTAVTLASQGAVLPPAAHQRPPAASPSARALAAGGGQRATRGRGLLSVLLSTTRNALRPFVPGWAGGSGEVGGGSRGASARDAASRSLRNRPFAAQTPDTTAAVVRAVLRTELPDLLRALYLIISLRRQLTRLGLPLRAISSLLVEAGHALLHLFYDTVFVGFAGGRDPLHLLLLSGGALGLQALLQSIGESPGSSPPPAGAPPADAAASSGRGLAGSAAREPASFPHHALAPVSAAAMASRDEHSGGDLHRVRARAAVGLAGSPPPSAPADSPLSASGSQGARLYTSAASRELSAWATASGVDGASGAWLAASAPAVRAPSQGALGFADVLPPSHSPSGGAARGRSRHLPDKAPADDLEVEEEEEDGPAAEGAWGVARAQDHLRATQHEDWSSGAAGASRGRGRARSPSDG